MGSGRELTKSTLLRLIGSAALSAAFSLSAGGASLGDISGTPRVVDGDTIIIGEERIRLYGIDAPEQRQSCLEDDLEWACGEEATATLKNMVGGRVVDCKGSEIGNYGLQGGSSMAEQKLPKLTTGVRFPSPAPICVIYVNNFHNVGSRVRSLRLRRTNHQYRLLV